MFGGPVAACMPDVCQVFWWQHFGDELPNVELALKLPLDFSAQSHTWGA